MTIRRALPLLLLAGCIAGSATDDRDGTGTQQRPATCPPADTFDHALCLCEDMNDVGQLSVVEGPAGVGSVGVNGFTRFVNLTRAVGDWIAYSGFEAVTDTEIAGSLATAGDARWVGWLKVGVDLAIGGDATGVGMLEVGGALSVGGSETMVPGSTVGSRTDYQPLAGPPCNCDPDTFFDVAGAVAAARTANDNAAAGLPTRLAAVGVNDLRLESGSYYFEDAATVGQTHITIAGQVAIYVEGTIATVGEQNITVEDGGSLDLFVSGMIASVGWTSTGSAAHPDAIRIYLGGSDRVLLAAVGAHDFHANLYAPEATLAYVGDNRVVGSLFGRTLDGVGALEIGYGAPADLDPPSCDDPGDGDGGDDGDDPGDGDPDDGDDGDDPGDGDPDDGDDGVD
jgi:hypothetical protein